VAAAVFLAVVALTAALLSLMRGSGKLSDSPLANAED
jgi:hypothetical protein